MNSVLKTGALVLFNLAIGFFVGKLVFSTSPEPSAEPFIQAADHGKVLKHLENLNLLREIERSKEESEKILSKMILAILLEIGVRKTDPRLESLAAIAEAPLLTNEPSLEQTNTSESPPAETPGSTILKQNPSIPKIPSPNSEVSNIRTEDEVNRFLKDRTDPDFIKNFIAKSPLTDQSFRLLSGTFEGDIIFDDPKKRPWRIQWSFEGSGSKANDISFTIEIFNEVGKQISNSRGRGSLKPELIGEHPKSGGLLVDVYGGDGFIEFFWFPRLDYFAGVYYRGSLSSGKVQRTGTTKLNRRQ